VGDPFPTQVLARDKPWRPARRSRIREGGYSATCGAFRASTSPSDPSEKVFREQTSCLSPYARLFLIEDAKTRRPQDSKSETQDL